MKKSGAPGSGFALQASQRYLQTWTPSSFFILLDARGALLGD